MKSSSVLKSIVALAALAIGGISNANATIVIANQVEGFLGSNKTQVTTAHGGTTQVSYDATGIDKLVAVFATESGFNSNTVNTMGMQFNGVSMTMGKFQQTFPNPIVNDNGAVAIFYLDNPFQGVSTFTASATTTGGGLNGGWVGILGLTGTADGIGNVAGTSYDDNLAGVKGTSITTSITTSGVDSLIIAGIENSGSNNVGAPNPPTVVSPLVLSNNGNWGGSWGNGAAGYQFVASSGSTVTPSFNVGTGRYVDVAAVEFLAVPEPATLGLAAFGLLGLIGLARRKR